MKKKKVPAPVEEVASAAAPVVAEKVEESKCVVNCPKCSTLLSVKTGNYAHLCPVCAQVFRIRTGEKLIKDVTRTTMVEAYVNVDRDVEGGVHTNTIVKEK